MMVIPSATGSGGTHVSRVLAFFVARLLCRNTDNPAILDRLLNRLTVRGLWGEFGQLMLPAEIIDRWRDIGHDLRPSTKTAPETQ